MHYLLIENQGEAPVEGYTVLGWSSTRDSDAEGVIGQFGSGTKHAVNLCLRHGLAVWVYCGKTRLEFGTEYEEVSDGLVTKEAWHVVYRKGNNEWRRTGWVLDFGLLDWDDTDMALREFISNAIDRTIREGGFDENLLTIKTVSDKERRAKAGTTRVYVELIDTVREYFGRLGRYFLHFSDNPESAKPGILTKANRCPNDTEGAVIYREGVYVRTLEGKSLFDYNFSRDELNIDECRNSSDYHVKAAVAKRVGKADAGTLSSIMRAAQSDIKEELLETSLEHYHMFGGYCVDPNETQQETWARAWEAAAGSDAVVCDDAFSHDYVEKKGFKPRIVNGNWSKSLKKIKTVKHASDVLNDDEKQGRTILEPTLDATKAVDWAWDVFSLCDLICEREKPVIKCFKEIQKAERMTCGFVKDSIVYINVDIANDGQNKELKKTAVEEVAHYVTGATDNSRDFQSFLIDALVDVCS